MKKLGRQTTTSFLFAACLWLATLDIDAAPGPLLYATDAETQQLFVLSTTDSSKSLVGDFGVPGYMADLAYDAHNDLLYGVTTLTDNLYSINRVTGAASLIGPLGLGGEPDEGCLMHSLAYDNVNGLLYGVSVTDSALYRISTATGQAVLVGNTGIISEDPYESIYGLAFNPADNVLYGSISASYTGRLYQINTATGQGTFLFSTTNFADLAFHPQTGVLYGIQNFDMQALYTIDLASETTSLVGLTGLGAGIGLEFAPVPEPGTFTLFLGAGLCILFWRTRGRGFP